MDVKFSIDLDAVKEKNGDRKTEALFQYTKYVSKNRTPLVLVCDKVEGFWKCVFYECAIPTSKFFEFYLPAPGDKNAVGSKFYITFTYKLLQNFVPNTSFIFGDNNVTVKNGAFKAKDAYENSSEEVKIMLEEFLGVIEEEEEDIDISIKIFQTSPLLKCIDNLGSTPKGSIFVTEKDITYGNDTFYFRMRNDDGLTTKGEDLYLNMYVANKILDMMDYCDEVELSITPIHTVIKGFVEEKEIVRNISVAFEAVGENPTDEDLESISPDEVSATKIVIDFQSLMDTFAKYKSTIANFIDTRDSEVTLYKNGSGISFGMNSDPNSGTNSKIVINVGEVEEEEPDESKFTPFAIHLPLRDISSIIGDNQTLEFIYDDNDDNAVKLISGEYKMLTGKLW